MLLKQLFNKNLSYLLLVAIVLITLLRPTWEVHKTDVEDRMLTSDRIAEKGKREQSRTKEQVRHNVQSSTDITRRDQQLSYSRGHMSTYYS